MTMRLSLVLLLVSCAPTPAPVYPLDHDAQPYRAPTPYDPCAYRPVNPGCEL